MYQQKIRPQIIESIGGQSASTEADSSLAEGAAAGQANNVKNSKDRPSFLLGQKSALKASTADPNEGY